MKPKRPVPFYYWPFWMFLLALGIFVFVSWIAERKRL